MNWDVEEWTEEDLAKLKREEPLKMIIRDKATGEIIAETFSQQIVDALDTKQYEAVPIPLKKSRHRFSNRKEVRREISERSK